MEWDNLYKKKTYRHKNMWPDNLIVQSITNNYIKANNNPKIKIFEFGFGWGNNLRFLKENNFNYFGIEQSKTAYLNCKKKGYKNIYLGNFVDNDIFDNNFFDCIIDRQSLHHNNINDIRKIIDIFYKKLKPKGMIFSHLISKANYEVKTTYFNKKRISNLFKKFTINKIEKHSTKIIKDKKIITNHEFYNLEFQKND